MSRWLFLLLISLVLWVPFSGCRDEPPPAAVSGYVGATEAYVRYFGNPPQGKKGRAYARVGYLPLRADPQKVQPMPLFLFEEQGQLAKILRRMSSELLILPDDSPVFKPFPSDLKIEVPAVVDGLQTLNLQSGQSWDSEKRQAAARAFAETALQYPEIERVRITLNGDPIAAMPADGYRHVPGAIADVGLPRLVLIAGHWEGEETAPKELMIEFDRPIRMNDFTLVDASGEKVEGDYYTSIFQMAVVVHPDDPDRYREGAQLRATWDVVDYLGRSNQGISTQPLMRYEH